MFLGAGASTPFGKPTTSQLRTKLISKHGNNRGYDYLQTILSCPIFEDVEHILKTIRDFASIHSTAYSGEFLNWLGRESLLMVRLNSGMYNYDNFMKSFDNIQSIIEDEVFSSYSWNKNESDPIATQILTPFLELIKTKSDEIVVFTTNYDRAVEEFCSGDNNYFCVDGFKLHEDSGRFLWNDGDYSYADKNGKTNVFLYKIHGSLNWKKHRNYGIERTPFELRQPKDDNYEDDLLIYPTVSPKEEANGKEPHNTILKKFDQAMKSIDVCIVIGFSFRDEHVNDKFKEFVDRGGVFITISPSSQYDFRTRILNHKPTKEEQQVWENSPYARLTGTKSKDSKNWNITFLQKKLEVGTIKEIIHDIQRILDPTKHPL